MGWETCTTHTDNAGFLDLSNDLFIRKFGHIFCLFVGNLIELTVTLDNNGIDHITNSYTSRLDRLDRS